MLLRRLYKRIVDFGHMIKFSHSVFALPFALSGAVLAADRAPLTLNALLWIILAMVGARSAAMGFNRLVDKKYDAENPRTKDRHLPSGRLGEKEIILFIIAFSILFIYASYRLNQLCFILSPVALAVVLLYSYTKRFTSFSHYVLGAALGLSPVGAWLAVTGYFAWPPIVLGVAVMFWVAGFDILYACQDIDFDREQKLFSLPSNLGPKKAMQISSLFHVLTMVFFLAMYINFQMHVIFLFFLALIAILLLIEHRLVKPDNLIHIDMAFFHINSVVSILLFIGVLTEVCFR